MDRLWIAVVGVLALSVGACGDDGDSETGAETGTSASSSDTTNVTSATSMSGSSQTFGATETAESGSEGTATTGDLDACMVIVGQTYLSVEEMECGLGPGGPVLCNWSISFSEGEYDWSYSDLNETGPYACDGFVVIGQAGESQYMGTLDFETGVLTWEGVEYLPAE